MCCTVFDNPCTHATTHWRKCLFFWHGNGKFHSQKSLSSDEWITAIHTRNARNDDEEKWNAQKMWMIQNEHAVECDILLSFADSKRQLARCFMVLSHEIIARWRTFNIVFEKIKKNWLWFTHSHFFLSLIDVSQSAGPPPLPSLPHTHTRLHRLLLPIAYDSVLGSVSASFAAKEATAASKNYKCRFVLGVINQNCNAVVAM